MSRSRLLTIFLVTVGCRAVPPGNDANWVRCKAADPDVSIAGCTTIVESDHTPDPSRAEALQDRGNAWRSKGDYNRSIQDYDHAIALRPGFASAFNSRGVTWQLRGMYDSAVSSFDHAIRLNPEHAMALKNRGRTRFFLGHFAEAAADLQQGLSLDSTNAYVVIWLHLARKHLGQHDVQEFTAQLARTDTVGWPAPVARYFLGHLTADQLLTAAVATDSKEQRDQRCAAAFYIGEFALLHHENAEAARRFQAALATCPKTWTEYEGAVAELERLRVSGGEHAPRARRSSR